MKNFITIGAVLLTSSIALPAHASQGVQPAAHTATSVKKTSKRVIVREALPTRHTAGQAGYGAHLVHLTQPTSATGIVMKPVKSTAKGRNFYTKRP